MTTTLTAPVDRAITLNGLRFNYRVWANEGAQPLVLLHGFTGHARTWDTFAAVMQQKYHVVALDQRGHGDSEWATDYAPERMVEDTDAFVKALGLKNYVLLGLSMGGRNAFGYAGTRPAELAKLVIVDIGPEVATAGGARIRSGVQAKDIFDTQEDAVAQMRKGNGRAPDSELRHRAIHNLKPTADGKFTWKYDAVLRSPDRGLPRPDAEGAWATVRNIAVPTLLIRGAESDVLSPEVAARMLEEIPDCTLVTVNDSGHSVPLDNPAGFREAVRDFLGV